MGNAGTTSPRRLRVCLVTDAPVAHPPTGDDLVTSQWIEALAARGPVDVWAVHGPASRQSRDTIRVRTLGAGSTGRVGVAWRWLARGEPLLSARNAGQDVAALEALLARERYDVVLLNHLRVASQVLRFRAPAARLWYLAHNCEAVAHDSLARIEARKWRRVALAREARLLQRHESATVQRAAGVVALTPEDARRFETMGARSPAVVVPPWVSPPSWQWREGGSARLLLVGSFTWHAKRANATWLATDVFPRVRSAVPDAELWLVGKGASLLGPGLRGVEGVHLRSDVPATAEFLQQAAVFVNPERQESGIKLKTLEAAAAGLPIVSTPAGVEGTGLGHGTDCLVAHDAEAFANAAVELLQSRERAAALGQAARRIVLDRFSRARFDDRLGALFARVAA